MIVGSTRSRGRPAISDNDKKVIVSKIEPYLKSGLSIRKSVIQAGISRATFYRLMNEDEHFRDQITSFKQFIPVLVNNGLIRELMLIVARQNGNERVGIQPQSLSKDDRSFLMWFATNSNLCREEYGRREQVSLFDPEAEIQKVNQLLEESTTKEIAFI